MKILVTGFDPFGGEKINPSSVVLRYLPDSIEKAQIIKQQLPTVFKKSIQQMIDYIDEFKPDVVLAIGQAAGRDALTMERIAINIDDARIPDNEGNQPIDEAIYPEGAAAYFTTLPIKKMVEAIKTAGIPGAVSNSAGTFVCNHVMYGALHYANQETAPSFRAGFMHIPIIDEQAEGSSEIYHMKLKDLVTGIIAALKSLAEDQDDIKIIGGSLH